MRRKEKEITDIQEIENIISKAKVCHLAVAEDNIPYVVPVCFGYASKAIYFHSAKAGKNIDIIKKNNRICFEFDTDSKIIESENPCKWGMKYRSVIGNGKAIIIEDVKEKQKALSIIMQNQASFISRFTLLLNPGKKRNFSIVANLSIRAHGLQCNPPHIFDLNPNLKPGIDVNT